MLDPAPLASFTLQPGDPVSMLGTLNGYADGTLVYVPSQKGLQRLLTTLRPTAVYLNLSINDFVTNSTASATVRSWEQQLVAWIRSLGVLQVFTDTCEPNTTSTDSWATTANQTITTGGNLATQRNASLRSLGAQAYAGFDFFIDWAGIAEAVIGGVPSGLWVPNGTTDGIHAVQSIAIIKGTTARQVFLTSFTVS